MKDRWCDYLWLNRAGWTEPKRPHLHYVLEFTALYASPIDDHGIGHDWYRTVEVDGPLLLRLMEGHDA
jgi:hypothetical protein